MKIFIKKTRLAFLFLLSVSFGVFAQQGSVSGNIKDHISKENLEYATVTISKIDGTLVSGVVTDNQGNFTIKKIKSGTYFLEASFIGYQSKKINNLIVNKSNTSVGSIFLKISNSLDEVIVRAASETVDYKIDREVFSAEKFQNSQGGNAVDVIKNLPSVTVTGEGTINVRGSESFAILINGKPSQADATTILGQLPANALEKVEIITAPSAKYDPEGTAGILNIITKKGALNGAYAQINIRGGFPPVQDYNTKVYPQRYGLDATYNKRNDNWNFSLGASYQRNDKSGRREGAVDIVKDANTHRFLPSDGERSFDDVSYNARFTVDYTPNESDEFSLGLYAGKRQKDRLADIYYSNYSLDGNGNRKDEFSYYNHNLRTRKGDFALASFDFAHVFENKSKISSSFLYEYTFLGGPTENDNVNDVDYAQIYQQEYNTNDNPLHGMRFNLDYQFKPYNIGTFETGYQFRHLDHAGDFIYTRKNQGDSNFVQVDEFSSAINLKRVIHSAYLQLSNSKNKWDYSAGVRLESMNREYKEKLASDTNENVYDFDFVKLFPSASVLYKLNSKTNLKAAYSKRVVRTTTFKMNSFAEREHSEVFEQGDNKLRPEFIDLVEIGINKKLKNGNSFYATAYFRHTKNVINRVNTLVYEKDTQNPGNFVVNDSIINRVYSNVGKSNAIGLELGATINPTNKWSNFIGVNVYNYAIDGFLNFNHRDDITRSYRIDSESLIYSLNLNSTYKFWNNASLQFALNYISDRNTAMGEDSRYYTPNLTFRKLFFDDNLAATLQWQNIDMGLLNSNEQRITTSRANQFYTTTNYVYEVDVISLNLSYTFNKTRKKTKFIESEFGKKEF